MSVPATHLAAQDADDTHEDRVLIFNGLRIAMGIHAGIYNAEDIEQAKVCCCHAPAALCIHNTAILAVTNDIAWCRLTHEQPTVGRQSS
jgi:hypothetical protein